MYTFLCGTGGSAVRLFLLLYFFSRLSGKSFHLVSALFWMLPWSLLEQTLPSPILKSAAEFLLLLLYGFLQVRAGWKHTVLISVLSLSVAFWSKGVAEAIGYWIAKEVGAKHLSVLQFLDLGIVAFSCGLLYFSLQGISKLFFQNLQYLYHQILLIAACPFLFVLLAEQLLASAVYGDTVIWSVADGLVYPQIQTAPILVLQLLAGATVLSILFLFHRLEKTISVEEENKFLLHQLAEQAGYMQEIQGHEKRLRSLQHDIKNHFLLLQELLNQHKIEEASSYLAELGGLSYQGEHPVRTGNATVDILLKSKLAAVSHKGAEIQCDLKIPNTSIITDLEWCVIFGNAVDNASQAIEAVPENERYLHIKGMQKGDFLYLHMENSCLKSLCSVVEGVGLSNLRTLVEKHSGTLTIEIGRGRFSLDILLLISQQ